ncbi:MAG: hypothetical protein KAJ51_06295, partial [Thermoplasmata archaeon]|nr:hypothetical protein [Thermoplasmata archaeon]
GYEVGDEVRYWIEAQLLNPTTKRAHSYPRASLGFIIILPFSSSSTNRPPNPNHKNPVGILRAVVKCFTFYLRSPNSYGIWTLNVICGSKLQKP